VSFQSIRQTSFPRTELPEGIAASALRHFDAARQIQTEIPRRAMGAILPLVCVPPYLDRLGRAGGDPAEPGLELSRFGRQRRMTMAAFRARI